MRGGGRGEVMRARHGRGAGMVRDRRWGEARRPGL